jgi:hypothetical protein
MVDVTLQAKEQQSTAPADGRASAAVLTTHLAAQLHRGLESLRVIFPSQPEPILCYSDAAYL